MTTRHSDFGHTYPLPCAKKEGLRRQPDKNFIASPRSQTSLKDCLKVNRHFRRLRSRGRANWSLLLAGFVIAFARDLDFFAACGSAIVAAVFLAFGNRTCAWLVSTDFSFFDCHTSLLRENAPQRSQLSRQSLRQEQMGIESIRFQSRQKH